MPVLKCHFVMIYLNMVYIEKKTALYELQSSHDICTLSERSLVLPIELSK